MFTPCESILKKFLPSLKSGIARELYETHHMKQMEIAKRLGITQAAVSKYLSARAPASSASASSANNKPMANAASHIARRMALENLSGDELSMAVCDVCLQLNKGYDCVFAKDKMNEMNEANQMKARPVL